MRIFDKCELSKAQQALLASEASILRQLRHPNIVEIISEQETDARLCQVFELTLVSLSGWTLFWKTWKSQGIEKWSGKSQGK